MVKKASTFVVFLFASCTLALSQNSLQSMNVSFCDLYEHPEDYIGRMVKVRGAVVGKELWVDSFTHQPCSSWMRIILILPKDAKPIPEFELVRDPSFEELDNALSGHPKNIEGTFEGQFHSVIVVRDGKRIRIGEGYGKRRDYDGRIVLHRVSDVTVKSLPKR